MLPPISSALQVHFRKPTLLSTSKFPSKGILKSHVRPHVHLSIEPDDFSLLEISFLHHHFHHTVILRQEVIVLLDQIFIGHPVSPVTVPAN